MWEIVQSGGYIMAPLLLFSVLAVAIIIERLWSLKQNKVLPKHLLVETLRLLHQGGIDKSMLSKLKNNSPLGEILVCGLLNRNRSAEFLKDTVEEEGRHVAHKLNKYINLLGTIAAISPLLGLLGTVIGMINVFATITTVGVGDPTMLAGGINKALITTATGLSVAIPALFFYRYFRARINTLILIMEKEAITLVKSL
ncbi:MAG: MotA/TolQ/ExbB proton channel family protein [Gammaproteobacteria bacterium]|nr:MAG: MotA/TolQ/ExbB proton channel family protein [Gammaproteobacteria bacterium]